MLKWEKDQALGILGWEPPTKKGRSEQPRYLTGKPEGFNAQVDIDAVLADPVVESVLERWAIVRHYFPDGAPPYSGGLLDAWPAVDVDAFAACHGEEAAIRSFVQWRERG